MTARPPAFAADHSVPTVLQRFALGPLLVTVVALLLAPVLWKPWIHGNDGVRNFAYCRSFWMDHDFDFSNEYEHYRRAGEMAPVEKIGGPDPVTGRPGNALGIGSAILWSPFFGGWGI